MNNKEEFNREIVKSFFATINLGLHRGYSDILIKKADVYLAIQQFQNSLIREKSLYLSLSVSECDIVMSGQIEPHLKLNFINYPKFPLEEKELKKHIEGLAKKLMVSFEQNRIVIEFSDETLMFEKTEEIDPKILPPITTKEERRCL